MRGLSNAILVCPLIGLLLPVTGQCTNWGLRYDGSDDVLRLASCLPISGDSPFTLELWILRRAGGGSWEEIGDSRGYSLFVHSSSRLYLNLASPGQSGAPDCCYMGAAATYTRFRSNLTVPVGLWVHIAIVWDGAQPVAYINGESDPMVYDITQESFTCCDFGDATPCYTPDPAPTTLDEIRVWNFARSQSDIVATMFTLLTGAEAGLINYWPMDEGSGQVTADWVAANHLQLGITSSSDAHDPSWAIADWLPPIPVQAHTWGRVKARFR